MIRACVQTSTALRLKRDVIKLVREVAFEIPCNLFSSIVLLNRQDSSQNECAVPRPEAQAQ